ncbi:MAG: hypothetical protein AAGC63_06420 [Propionicimonas sp.]|nr:hypothetical protein [Propionicimonas sp.]
MHDEFGVYYQPALAAGQVARARTGLIWRLGWTALIVAIGVGGWLLYPEQFGPSAPWFIGSAVVVGLALGGWELARFLTARSDAARVAPGLALGANRYGVLVGADWYPWGEVGSLVVRPGRLGASSRLVATGRDARTREVLLDYTDVLPASLDSAVVALSAGRARVDLSRLDA